MAIKNITVQEAKQRQDEGDTYVDVRSVPEFAQAHPSGAVNVPLLHRDERSGQMTPNREFLQVMQEHFAPDARLLIGCQAGARSAQAAQLLAASGFTNVSNVLGGFGGSHDQQHGGWLRAGLPVDAGEPPGRSYESLRGSGSHPRQ